MIRKLRNLLLLLIAVLLLAGGILIKNNNRQAPTPTKEELAASLERPSSIWQPTGTGFWPRKTPSSSG